MEAADPTETAGNHAPSRDTFIEVVWRLTLAAEFGDEHSHSHIRRIGRYTEFISGRLGIPKAEADVMCFASPMHDIGKAGIPEAILTKPGRLTSKEREIVKGHTLIGGKLLHGSNDPILISAEKFALFHHERWDGTGYPFGRKGKDIPIEGRIMFLIDHYDNLRSRRPFKIAYDHNTVFRIITQGSDVTMPKHFDPDLLEIFAAHSDKFLEIFDTNARP